jgi:peptidoglycan hydrolase-like protein with peptidoglycan-binding domain
MRSRLLVSAAVLAAGLAVASAQNAPGGGQEHTRNQARSQNHRSPAAAPRKADQPLRTRATDFNFQKGLNNPRRSERGTAARGESAPLMRPHGARGVARPPTKPNDASVLLPRSQRGRGDDGLSGDRSLWNGAMGQGRLPRGQQDLARNKTPRRQADQGMGRAGDQAVHSDRDRYTARNQTRSVAWHHERHRGGALNVNAGLEQVRKVQTALNQQGFNVGDPDGKLGKRTKEALIAFQKKRGFRTTGNVDSTTLHALLAAGAAPGGSPGSSQPSPTPAPIQTAPPGVPPATTGRGDTAPEPAAPPQPADAETPPAPDGLQMPETGASGRVPAGSPQEDYKDETAAPAGGDQR